MKSDYQLRHVYVSVLLPHGTPRFPPDEFSKKKMVFEYLLKTCRENSSFIKI